MSKVRILEIDEMYDVLNLIYVKMLVSFEYPSAKSGKIEWNDKWKKATATITILSKKSLIFDRTIDQKINKQDNTNWLE